MNSQFARYLIVGAANTLFGYVIIFAAMYIFKLSPELSNIVGYGIGLMVSFMANRKFTFRSSAKPFAEFSRFVIVFLVAFGANFLALFLLVRVYFVHEAFSQVLAGAVYVVGSYSMNKIFVFRTTHCEIRN